MPEILRSLALPLNSACLHHPSRRRVRMITRLWQGYTTPENADAYESFIRTEVFPKLHEVRGFLGGKLLRRNLFQEVEFVALTHFDSLESVRTAAGDEFSYIIIP